MITTVVVVALLGLVGLLLFQNVQAYRTSNSAGVRSLAGAALPLLVLVLSNWLSPGAVSPALDWVEGLGVLARLAIGVLAGFLVVLVVDRTNTDNPTGEVFTSALLIWVIWTWIEAPGDSRTTFSYAIGGLIGAALYLVLFGRRSRIVSAVTQLGTRSDTKS